MTDLERMQSILKELEVAFISYGNLHDDEEHGCKVIEKALKRDIPMKPVFKNCEGIMHVNNGNRPHEIVRRKWQSWCCPVCGWFVGERYNRVRNDGSVHPHDQRKSNYCNECGQRIDWGGAK